MAIISTFTDLTAINYW